MSRQTLNDIYQRLFDRYGPQHWWPGDTRFEIIIGAILTQNTNWNNVEKAIANLKAAGCLTPRAMHEITAEQLAPLIRPAGYFNQKSQRLKILLDWLFDQYDSDIDALADLPTSTLREQLLTLKGIGPETADSICLYAFDKPLFVVDAYTARIFGRHGLLEPGCGYHDIQEMAHASLDQDVKLYNEFHALIVRAGKEHCKKKPNCNNCPLEDLPRQLETETY